MRPQRRTGDSGVLVKRKASEQRGAWVSQPGTPPTKGVSSVGTDSSLVHWNQLMNGPLHLLSLTPCRARGPLRRWDCFTLPDAVGTSREVHIRR